MTKFDTHIIFDYFLPSKVGSMVTIVILTTGQMLVLSCHNTYGN